MNKDKEEVLKLLDGEEFYIGDTLYLFDCSNGFIINKGRKTKLTPALKSKAYREYFNNSLNDGYWVGK